MQKKKARRKHFTEENVLRIPARREQYLIWDIASKKGGDDASRGLSILVNPTGTKSYRCVYYYPGSSRAHSMHLGRVGEMTLASARAMTRAARGKARDGKDPSVGKATHSDGFKDTFNYYVKHDQIGRAENKSAEESQAIVLKHCADWHSRPVATIRYGEVEALLFLIRDTNQTPYMANRIYSHLRDFFGWCVRTQRIAASPMSEMRRPWEGEQRRERPWFEGALADATIRALWAAADKIKGDEGRYLKTMILLGKRKSALADMKWEHIDADWYWDAPPSKSANKKLFGVPLAKFTQRVLSPRKKEGRVFGMIDPDRVTRLARKQDGVPPDFFLHGVRHILETKTAELDILPHVRDMLFDHAPLRGSGKKYDHHKYKTQMAPAAETWAAYVEGLVAVKGVRKLR